MVPHETKEVIFSEPGIFTLPRQDISDSQQVGKTALLQAKYIF